MITLIKHIQCSEANQQGLHHHIENKDKSSYPYFSPIPFNTSTGSTEPNPTPTPNILFFPIFHVANLAHPN